MSKANDVVESLPGLKRRFDESREEMMDTYDRVIDSIEQLHRSLESIQMLKGAAVRAVDDGNVETFESLMRRTKTFARDGVLNHVGLLSDAAKLLEGYAIRNGGT